MFVQCRRHRLVVTAGRFHENFCVLTQVNNGIGHLLQTNVCVRKFTGSKSHFPHWPQGGHHAFALGYVDPDCVHFQPPGF